MLFNIFWFEDLRGDDVQYVETIEAPDAEAAILRFAEREFGKQNAFKPERWSHIPGSDIIGHRYNGFYQASICDCCERCTSISCTEK